MPITPKKNLGKSGQPSLKLLICRQGYRRSAGGFYKYLTKIRPFNRPRSGRLPRFIQIYWSPCRDVACYYVPTLNVHTTTHDDDYDLSQIMSELSPKSGSLSTIIRSFKSAVTRWCKQNNYNNFAWQPRFYEHIIRNDGSIDKIREYIINNPRKWSKDKNNPINLKN